MRFIFSARSEIPTFVGTVCCSWCPVFFILLHENIVLRGGGKGGGEQPAGRHAANADKCSGDSNMALLLVPSPIVSLSRVKTNEDKSSHSK